MVSFSLCVIHQFIFWDLKQAKKLKLECICGWTVWLWRHCTLPVTGCSLFSQFLYVLWTSNTLRLLWTHCLFMGVYESVLCMLPCRCQFGYVIWWCHTVHPLSTFPPPLSMVHPVLLSFWRFIILDSGLIAPGFYLCLLVYYILRILFLASDSVRQSVSINVVSLSVCNL